MDALDRFDHPAWVTAAGTLVSYGLVLLVVFAALLFGLALIAVAALVQVPIVVYLRYYALFVLGDTEPDFDVITERRNSVRNNATGA